MAFGTRKLKRGRHPYCGAVVAAAGKSTRMDGEDKLFAMLGGVPLIIRTLTALSDCPDIDVIVVAARSEDILPLSHLCHQHTLKKVRSIVQGGETRPQSVLGGLLALPAKAELAAVHDAARPFVSSAVISAAICQAAKSGASAPAVLAKDTIKLVSGGRVEKTLDRGAAMLIQTPQVFHAGLLKGVLTRAIREKWEITDDCGAMERMGMTVMITEGAYENIKVTTPEDLIFAQALVEKAAMDHENRPRV
ncbi:MAG: 2-C-methyl-D-erythritol 4-phosphate cytidylyltransferase [Oscillospiraceae bacterium]|nr:2-C-methyl-D-erythritol 4-phosphate cytidylyltransferase [Oscillospiraceae bacterium]